MTDGPHRRLGTFLGVFTPTILTILGVIMYLRFGWVVGHAGLGGALLIVVLANAITLATALSVSSLATNMRVGVGGAYYIISRSLGLEIGGAIGLPLYLSQALSVTLYSYGLAESLRIVWPGAPVPWLAALFVAAVTAIAVRSTSFALRAQVPIMVFVGLSIASLLAGADWHRAAVEVHGSEVGFWRVFAVFFPAVTGILAGISLSGDLEDPERSLPLGTLSAVLVGLAIYLVVPVALARSLDVATLREDPLAWMRVAAVPALVLPGLWGAILSSAIGSILAAPRTLQALAGDGVLPAWLGAVEEETGEPRRALAISAGIALGAVALGELNAVAEVVTMFFLTTYGMINVVCGLEALIGDPSFRPRFRLHRLVPLLGAASCFGVMFLISPLSSAVALVLEFAFYLLLSRRRLEAAWGDMRGGVFMSLARLALLLRQQAPPHPRSWRPNILVFTRDVAGNLDTIDLASSFSVGRGIVTVATLLVGDVEEHGDLQEREARHRRLLEERGLVAFPEVDVVPDLETGLLTVAQANGIAGLRSNTVLLGWPDQSDFLVPVLRVMRRLARLERSLLLVRLEGGLADLPGRRTLLVWWRGRHENGDLMLLLAWLLQQEPRWRRSRIVLRSIVGDPAEAEARLEDLRREIHQVRIAAHPEVIVRPPGVDTRDLIAEHSRDATLVFLGLAIPEPGEEERVAAHLRRLVEPLPRVVLVRNEGPFRGALL